METADADGKDGDGDGGGDGDGDGSNASILSDLEAIPTKFGKEASIVGEIKVEAKKFSIRIVSGVFFIKEKHKKWERDFQILKEQMIWMGKILFSRSRGDGILRFKSLAKGMMSVKEGRNYWGDFISFNFGNGNFLTFPSGIGGFEWKRVSYWFSDLLESLIHSTDEDKCPEVTQVHQIPQANYTVIRDLNDKINDLNARVEKVLHELSFFRRTVEQIWDNTSDGGDVEESVKSVVAEQDSCIIGRELARKEENSGLEISCFNLRSENVSPECGNALTWEEQSGVFYHKRRTEVSLFQSTKSHTGEDETIAICGSLREEFNGCPNSVGQKCEGGPESFSGTYGWEDDADVAVLSSRDGVAGALIAAEESLSGLSGSGAVSCEFECSKSPAFGMVKGPWDHNDNISENPTLGCCQNNDMELDSESGMERNWGKAMVTLETNEDAGCTPMLVHPRVTREKAFAMLCRGSVFEEAPLESLREESIVLSPEDKEEAVSGTWKKLKEDLHETGSVSEKEEEVNPGDWSCFVEEDFIRKGGSLRPTWERMDTREIIGERYENREVIGALGDNWPQQDCGDQYNLSQIIPAAADYWDIDDAEDSITLQVGEGNKHLREQRRWEVCAANLKKHLRRKEEALWMEDIPEGFSMGELIPIDGELFDGLAILKMLTPPSRAKRSRLAFHYWSSLVGRPLLRKLKNAGVDVDLDLFGKDRLVSARKP